LIAPLGRRAKIIEQSRQMPQPASGWRVSRKPGEGGEGVQEVKAVRVELNGDLFLTRTDLLPLA